MWTDVVGAVWFVAVSTILLIPVFIIVGIATHTSAHDNFIADCQKEHKIYECELMWRKGE